MKKTLSIIFSIMLILSFVCSCNVKNVENTTEITVSKNDILRNNIKTKLVDKYNYIYEVTTYKFDDEKKDHRWHLYYEKSDNSYNVALVDGAYECYYYNNSIYYTTEEIQNKEGWPEYRTLIHLNEKYDSLVEACLVEDDILKNVYVIGSHTEKAPDGGYITNFEYVATNSVANEFSMWDIEPNQKMSTVYNLNKDFEINKVKYYKYEDNKKILMGETDYFYGEKAVFPETIVNMHNSEDKVELKIIQNLGTSSEREDVYYVAKGTRIAGNGVMMNANITYDLSRTQKFNYDSYIMENTVLYASLYR